MITVIEWVGAIIAVILMTISIVIIMNTIRTAVYARRTEIEIMKLVGATDWFVRWPFILEGMLGGLASRDLLRGGRVSRAYRVFVQAAQGHLLSVPFDGRYTVTLLIVAADRWRCRRCLRELPRRPPFPLGVIAGILVRGIVSLTIATSLFAIAQPTAADQITEHISQEQRQLNQAKSEIASLKAQIAAAQNQETALTAIITAPQSPDQRDAGAGRGSDKPSSPPSTRS